MTAFRWPLAISRFTVADRLKIGWWILRGHQLTAGPMVRRYEEVWERYTGSPHAIMVSSGSAANELLALLRREQLQRAGHWPQRNRVIVPACNWVTSVAPWLRLGFEPVWVDISENLCATVEDILRIIAKDPLVGTVFYVTLLGQSTRLRSLKALCDNAGVALMLDNCEASLSWTDGGYYVPGEGFCGPPIHFCTVATSSTSFHFSHPVTTGTEGGMIFCRDELDANWFRMMRNHGLTRGMPAQYRNPDVHASFDFALRGTNSRSTDLQAYMGLLLFDRALEFAPRRTLLAEIFYETLDRRSFTNVTLGRVSNPLMALPIVPSPTNRLDGAGEAMRRMLAARHIEFRPIVGGNLLRHTAFAGCGDARTLPRAEWAHDNGVYVGLHHGVTERMVRELAEALNGL